MRQKTQNHFFKLSIHLSVRKSREKLQANIWKIQSKPLEKFKHRYAPKIFLIQSFSLQLQSTIFFFFLRTAVLPKLFDIRFSYKHCNFSHVCLLVKIASKTMTGSILFSLPRRALFLLTKAQTCIDRVRHLENK